MGMFDDLNHYHARAEEIGLLAELKLRRIFGALDDRLCNIASFVEELPSTTSIIARALLYSIEHHIENELSDEEMAALRLLARAGKP